VEGREEGEGEGKEGEELGEGLTSTEMKIFRLSFFTYLF
jgi:hypothetical protein